MTEPAFAIVQVIRAFTAPPETVFDAWLDPKGIGAWMFGHTRGEEVVHTNIDPRVGGNFSFLVRRDGKEFDHIGRYFEIERPRRLVFSWGVAQDSGDSSRVVLGFAPIEGGAMNLTLTHLLDPAWTQHSDRIQASWTKILDKLAQTLG